MTDEELMYQALALAEQSAREGEVPVGCVVTLDGRIVGRGRNRREKSKTALAHAELEAISEACRTLGGWRLWQCTLYVTLEPCPMCAGAILNAQIPRVVYGARDPDDVERLVVPKLLKTFPQLKGVKIDYRWTGNFLLTLSRMPQFGRLDTNIYYMQGYSGHGVTCTHLAGRLIAELLRGDAERFDAFANLPHYPFPGGRTLRVPFTAMGAAYYSLRDRLGV